MSASKTVHDAPGLLAGTELQFLRALKWLADAPAGSRIGLETGDDVVVESSTGLRTIQEQDKSSISEKGHPYTDRSSALWKTLSIWASHLTQADTAPHRLLLVTNRPVPDCLARRISEADTEEAAEECVKQLEAIVKELTNKVTLYAQRLFALDKSELLSLILKVRLCDGETLVLEEYSANIASALHFPSRAGDAAILVDALSGWLHRRCLETWRSGAQAWVERDQFDSQYHAILHQFRRDRIRERAAALISIDPGEKELARTKLFVKQLLMVESEDPEIDQALTCYLQFGTERLRLTEIGDITEADWDGFFSNLGERWRRLQRVTILDRLSADEKEVGKTIMRRTVDVGHCAELAGQQTSGEYFTSGGYHRLADDAEVWWHPSFHSKLREGGDS